MLSKELKLFLEQQNNPWTHAFIAKGNAKNEAPDFVWEQGKEKVFDLASMTKALFTAPMIHKNIKLNQALKDVFGSEVSGEFGELKLSEILSHQSGLPPWKNFWINQFDDNHRFKNEETGTHWKRVLKRLGDMNLQNKAFSYSDVGYIVLGFVLSKIKNKSLHELAVDWFAGSDIGFLPKNTENIVPTAFCALQKMRLQGVPHDENCRSLGGVSGHAGLFGSGKGLTTWLHKTTKTLEFKGFLDAASNFEGTENSVLGWRRYDSSAGFGGGIGHYGFTGTALMIDPTTYNYNIILSNAVHGHRNPSQRTRLRELVFNELGS